VATDNCQESIRAFSLFSPEGAGITGGDGYVTKVHPEFYRTPFSSLLGKVGDIEHRGIFIQNIRATGKPIYVTPLQG